MSKKNKMEFIDPNENFMITCKVWAANVSKGKEFATTRRAYLLKATSNRIYAWKYKHHKKTQLPEPLLLIDINNSEIVNYEEKKLFNCVTIKTQENKIILFEFTKKEINFCNDLLKLFKFKKEQIHDEKISVPTSQPTSIPTDIHYEEIDNTFDQPLDAVLNRSITPIETKNEQLDTSMAVTQKDICTTIEYVNTGSIKIIDAKNWALEAKKYRIDGSNPELCKEALDLMCSLQATDINSFYKLIEYKRKLS